MKASSSRLLNVQIETIDSPVYLIKLNGQEALSQLFSYQLTLLSPDKLNNSNMIAKKIYCMINPQSKQALAAKPQQIHGLISKWSTKQKQLNGLWSHTITVTPWLSFLANNIDNRLFSQQSIPEIINDIFRSNGYHDYEFTLTQDYLKLAQCTQTNESDFDFILRLLMQTSLSFYFKHSPDKHVLVLSDSIADDTSLNTTDKQENQQQSPCFFNWQRYQAEGYPQQQSQQPYHQLIGIDNTAQAKLNRNVPHISTAGFFIFSSSNACDLYPALHFNLTDYDNNTSSSKYLLYSIRHTAIDTNLPLGYRNPNTQQQTSYTNNLIAIPAKQCVIAANPPREEQSTTGCQLVEITTLDNQDTVMDSHAKIPCSYPWLSDNDHGQGKNFWARTRQSIANQFQGSQFIPRATQKALVQFSYQHEQQPLLLGNPLHEGQQASFKLTDNQAQSGIQTRSINRQQQSLNHSLIFDDTAGKEKIILNSQRDLQLKINQSSKQIIKSNQSETTKKGSWQLNSQSHCTLNANEKINITVGTSSLTLDKSNVNVNAELIVINVQED